ncbi:MAG: hydrogenase expression/formation protein HypE [Clostridiales bacterium]
MNEFITMAHGSGGLFTSELINNIFYKHFENEFLSTGDDCAKLLIKNNKIAFTTDSFVITPIFFRGGDIGKLSICGTINDLVTSGAKPVYLSCSFIIEEGFLISDLEKIVISMAKEVKKSNVKIVTGDTKVVPKGECDKIFINTTGIGLLDDDINISCKNAEVGNRIIVTGSIGDHGCSILLDREFFGIETDIKSDCSSMDSIFEEIKYIGNDLKVLRDPTRGGLATVLNEIAIKSNVGIKIYENRIRIKDSTRGICEIMGFDPLYMANEGKLVIIVSEKKAEETLEKLKKHKNGKESVIIGEVISDYKKKVIMETIVGSNRIVDVMVGDQLPRIC